MRRSIPFVLAVALLALPAGASALTVSKAELRGGQLRVEGAGAAPGIRLTVTSSTSAASARVDLKGAFRVAATDFRADDCKAIVSDGRTPIAQPTLAGCTPKPVTPVTTPAPPSGACVIAPGDPATFTVGDVQSFFFTTTGCDTTNGPVQWSLVAGQVPPGMDAPIFQGQVSGEVTGRPTTEGTYTFTVQVTDSAGATDQETFTITVVGPRPVTITTPAALPHAARGQGYAVALSADGGLPGYAWTVSSGTPPPGLRLTGSTLAGTATTAGTSTFTITVADSRGTTSAQTFTLTVE